MNGITFDNMSLGCPENEYIVITTKLYVLEWGTDIISIYIYIRLLPVYVCR